MSSFILRIDVLARMALSLYCHLASKQTVPENKQVEETN